MGISRKMSPTNLEKRIVMGIKPEKLAEFQFIFVRIKLSRSIWLLDVSPT